MIKKTLAIVLLCIATNAQAQVLEGLIAEMSASMKSADAATIMQLIQTSASMVQMVETGLRTYDNIVAQLETAKAQFDFMVETSKALANGGFRDFNDFRRRINGFADGLQGLATEIESIDTIKFGNVDLSLALFDPEEFNKGMSEEWEVRQRNNDDWRGLKQFGFNSNVVKTLQQAEHLDKIIGTTIARGVAATKVGILRWEKMLSKANNENLGLDETGVKKDADPTQVQLTQVTNDIMLTMAQMMLDERDKQQALILNEQNKADIERNIAFQEGMANLLADIVSTSDPALIEDIMKQIDQYGPQTSTYNASLVYDYTFPIPMEEIFIESDILNYITP